MFIESRSVVEGIAEAKEASEGTERRRDEPIPAVAATLKEVQLAGVKVGKLGQ